MSSGNDSCKSMGIVIEEPDNTIEGYRTISEPDLGDDQAFPFIPGFGKNSGKDWSLLDKEIESKYVKQIQLFSSSLNPFNTLINYIHKNVKLKIFTRSKLLDEVEIIWVKWKISFNLLFLIYWYIFPNLNKLVNNWLKKT